MNLFQFFTEKYTEKKLTGFLLVIGLLGIMLISADDIFPEQKVADNQVISTVEFKHQLEKELTDILSSIDGAGTVKVMITLESGQENIYAWQEKTTKDQQSSADELKKTSEKYMYENTIVLIDDGSQKKALVEKIVEPVIKGVVIVSPGADDISVVSDITNAVGVALNITSNRICVIKMK